MEREELAFDAYRTAQKALMTEIGNDVTKTHVGSTKSSFHTFNNKTGEG